MKQVKSLCPLFFAAVIQSGSSYVGLATCQPKCCMWAMRKTAMGEDGQYRTVGYRCAVANGSDRYVEIEEVK